MWITIGVCCLQSPKREEWKLEKENKRLTFLLSSNIYTPYVTGHQSGEVRDGTRRPTTVCQFSTCRRSRVVLYTFKNIFGVIILERGILLHFFRLFIRVDYGSSRHVRNSDHFRRPVTNRWYWTNRYIWLFYEELDYKKGSSWLETVVYVCRAKTPM